ncbi:HNH endonuclease signature motif containing protein [Microbacterium sp. NPDC077057]|uniref:HNH endonuclease n=1 Tax=unclassified Microbacterium TaxID=2609290 RepID=UPI003444B6DD
MTREVHALRPDAAAWYSGILDEVTAVLPSSLDRARQFLEPIAGEVWMGTLTLHGPATAGSEVRSSRRVSDRTRAEVFLRDGFVCTYCGGRTIPRCILAAISDVFPDGFPYYAHYRRGTVHPAYWALAPEADHVLAHAGGGSSDPENLTTLHAMCNTRKSSLDAASLSVAAAPAHDSEWDGLLSRYARIVAAGENTGRRHAAPGYHPSWLRRFERSLLPVEDISNARP